MRRERRFRQLPVIGALRAGARRITRKPGRVESVRFGFNPNSSSLGIDISFLLVGLSGVAVLTAAIGAWLSASTPPPSPPPDEPGA